MVRYTPIREIKDKDKNYSHTVKIDNDTRKEIVKIASTNPRDLGLKFSTWSLRSLASGYLTKEEEEDNKIVKYGISHTRIKEILKMKVKNRMEKFKDSTGKERVEILNMNWKKEDWADKIYYTPPDSILLYQDEKGSIAAKTYGGPSWCSLHKPR